MLRTFCLLLISSVAFSLKAEIDPHDFDYEELDSLMMVQKPETFQTPELLSAFINEKYKTDQEKFRAIFVWVTVHVSYCDTCPKMTTQEVFKSQKAKCNDYADLLNLLCGECNLKARKVNGIVKKDSHYLKTNYTPSEVWNIVVINGKEYCTDATWSAWSNKPESKSFNADYDDTYFLPNPLTFILNHFPDNSADQLLPVPISKKTFTDNPYFSPKAINYGITAFSPTSSELKAKTNDVISFNFAMEFTPVHMSIEILNDLNDQRPWQEDIQFIENKTGIDFNFRVSQTQDFYLCIRFDEQDAVYYKVLVSK